MLLITTQNSTRWLLAGIIALGALFYISGIKKNLPYTAEMDEREKHLQAVYRMLSDGDLNPGDFEHPSSTTFYPHALIIHIQYMLYKGDALVWPDRDLQAMFKAHPTRIFVSARLLNVLYACLCLIALYRFGREWYGERVGIYSAWLLVCILMVVQNSQNMRSDMAATFFGLVSIIQAFRVSRNASAKTHVLAGIALGLATASRYFMASLAVVLVFVDMRLYLRRELALKKLVAWLSLAAVSSVLTFAAITPYFFIDFETVMESFFLQNREIHLGADGLEPPQNLWWYLSVVFPLTLHWPRYLVLIAGSLLAIYRRRFPELALLAFLGLYLLIISLPTLHWHRWLMPVFPVAMLLVALTVEHFVNRLPGFLRAVRRTPNQSEPKPGILLSSAEAPAQPYSTAPLFSRWQEWLGAVLLLALTIPALIDLVVYGIQQTRPGTRLLARQWIIEHISPTHKVALETYGAPLSRTNIPNDVYFSLPDSHSLQTFCDLGYDYLVTTSAISDRYFSQPERYARQIAFYEKLEAQHKLRAVFQPSRFTRDSTIKIYQLRCRINHASSQ